MTPALWVTCHQQSSRSNGHIAPGPCMDGATLVQTNNPQQVGWLLCQSLSPIGRYVSRLSAMSSAEAIQCMALPASEEVRLARPLMHMITLPVAILTIDATKATGVATHAWKNHARVLMTPLALITTPCAVLTAIGCNYFMQFSTSMKHVTLACITATMCLHNVQSHVCMVVLCGAVLTLFVLPSFAPSHDTGGQSAVLAVHYCCCNCWGPATGADGARSVHWMDRVRR